MRKRLPRLIRPSMRLYFIFLVLFAALTFFIEKGNHYLALCELAVILLLAIYTRLETRRRADTLSRYIETVADSIGAASQDSLSRTPLPVVVFSVKTGNVLWANDLFNRITGAREHFFEIAVTDLVPNFNADWLLAGGSESPEPVTVGDRRFKVYATQFRSAAIDGKDDYLATTYWVDVTDYDSTREEYELSRPVASIIAIDSYEEILKNLNERDKSAILSDIDARLVAWTNELGGYLRRYDRDRYLYICEERSAAKFAQDKFSVLETVRALTGAGGAHASLSVGVGRDGKTIEESVRYAQLALEMALSRGGDQAVIKNRLNFEFFGGNSAETERRTKVKSRVMASALGELIADSEDVFVMGHRNADYDSVGAAVGICRIAWAKGKPAFIVLDRNERGRAMAEKLIQHVKTLNEYEGVFITDADAESIAGENSLLVVVDTSRPEETQSQELLESFSRVAVIDHHRRAATFIDDAALTFHEPYASSASELVTEMMQYLVDQSDILKIEAEALLCGIVLDTKTFAIHTGSRTFDAAAYLRRLGADTAEVKAIMQSDFATAMQRYDIVRSARIFDEKAGIAIAVSTKRETRVSVAQAADELLNIAGVTCSFVVAPTEDSVFVSGRSIGQVNVQLILEKLGGGGNQSVAGATVRDHDAESAASELARVIGEYLADNKIEEMKR